MNEELVKLILIEYQKVFLEIGNHRIEENGMRYGIPPKSIIVKYHDMYSPYKYKIGNILSSWRVSKDSIDKLIDQNSEAASEPRDGMYFNEGRGYFSIDDNNEKVYMQWFVGPRYGRGFIYKVLQNSTGGMWLLKDKLILIS